MNKKRIVIFASGRGSNAEAIHEACENGTVNGEVVGVICDHAGAQVLERARQLECTLHGHRIKILREQGSFQ